MVVNPGKSFETFRLIVRKSSRKSPGVLCEKGILKLCMDQ